MKKVYLNNILIVFSIFLLTSCTNTTERGFANVNGTSLYYEITGKGTPLVFIHGYTCDHRNWKPQVEYFSKDYKVITYDVRGHGQSSVPDSAQYTHAEDLTALLDYLEIEDAVVIGHSMGGAPAFMYAKDNPEKVLALVLAEGSLVIDDPAIPDTTNYAEDYFKEFREAITVAREEGLEKGKEAWLNIQPLKTAAENPVSAELLKTMINDFSGWHWYNKNPHKRNPRGTIELMRQIKCPTLIIGGELSHPVMGELVNTLEKYVPNSKKVIIKNSNHMLNIENPDQFNNELKIFLKEKMID